jgi:hypothetical protein
MRHIAIATATAALMAGATIVSTADAADLYTTPPPTAEARPPAEEAPPPIAEAPPPVEVAPPAVVVVPERRIVVEPV